MTRILGVGAATAARIRAAMFGAPDTGISVTRQAWRVRDVDSDELALLDAPDGWWVARRMGDQLAVWAYPGEDEAHIGFDRLVASTGGDWTEALATPLAG